MQVNISKLEKERKRLNLTKSAFSRYFWLQSSTYGKMIQTQSTSIICLNRIAKILDFDPKDLLT